MAGKREDSLVAIYAYPHPLRPELPKVKFKGLTQKEAHEKHRELLKIGYTKINVS